MATDAISLRDACEWNPVANREATNRDAPHARAEVELGKACAWRLCAACAELPRFRIYTQRRPIGQAAEEAEVA